MTQLKTSSIFRTYDKLLAIGFLAILEDPCSASHVITQLNHFRTAFWMNYELRIRVHGSHFSNILYCKHVVGIAVAFPENHLFLSELLNIIAQILVWHPNHFI